MDLDLSQINLNTVGVSWGVAFAVVLIVNVAKAKFIPVDIPERWQALVANVGAAAATIATLHLMGAPVKVAVISGLMPLLSSPSGLHSSVSKPKESDPEPTPVRVVNPSSTQGPTVIVTPADAPAVLASLAPPPPSSEPPTPATGGTS